MDWQTFKPSQHLTKDWQTCPYRYSDDASNDFWRDRECQALHLGAAHISLGHTSLGDKPNYFGETGSCFRPNGTRPFLPSDWKKKHFKFPEKNSSRLTSKKKTSSGRNKDASIGFLFWDGTDVRSPGEPQVGFHLVLDVSWSCRAYFKCSERMHYRLTDRPTDGRTKPLIEDASKKKLQNDRPSRWQKTQPRCVREAELFVNLYV